MGRFAPTPLAGLTLDGIRTLGYDPAPLRGSPAAGSTAAASMVASSMVLSLKAFSEQYWG